MLKMDGMVKGNEMRGKRIRRYVECEGEGVGELGATCDSPISSSHQEFFPFATLNNVIPFIGSSLPRSQRRPSAVQRKKKIIISLVPCNQTFIVFAIMIPLSMQHDTLTRWKQTVAIYMAPITSHHLFSQ